VLTFSLLEATIWRQISTPRRQGIGWETQIFPSLAGAQDWIRIRVKEKFRLDFWISLARGAIKVGWRRQVRWSGAGIGRNDKNLRRSLDCTPEVLRQGANGGLLIFQCRDFSSTLNSISPRHATARNGRSPSVHCGTPVGLPHLTSRWEHPAPSRQGYSNAGTVYSAAPVHIVDSRNRDC
jgi:hypothetical protein